MDSHKVIIIAEAGVNHNGSIKIAKKMIDLAEEAGADYIKFQTFKAESLVTNKADKASYQKKLTDKDESHFEMLKKLELNETAHKELIKYCNDKDIIFLSTAFDLDSINLLNKLNIPIIKIPSGEITNLPYLRHIGRIRKPIIMSTGMSTMQEIKSALDVLYEAGVEKNQITILHCNTEYPTPVQHVNLMAMTTIGNKFGVSIGYSDHTQGIEIPFTLDRSLPGPDHSASLDVNELKAMILAIRNIEKAFGNGVKKPSPSERKNIIISRKSIVAKTAIKKGDVFTEDNLTVKRPGTGISPMEWDSYFNKLSDRDYQKDELIK